MRIAPGGIGFAPEMIALNAIMPHILFLSKERGQHDRLSDIACTGWPRRDCGMGGTVMSAECFAKLVIGRRFAPTRWLAHTISNREA